MNIDTVIFDLDGTLIDSAPSILASMKAAFDTVGHPPCRAFEPQLIGPPLRETLATLAGTENPALLDALSAAFMAHYDHVGYRAAEPYAGASELLEALCGQGFRLWIATNKRSHPTRLILEHLGWQHHFTGVVSPDTFTPATRSKTEMLGQILARHPLDQRRTLYVGDRQEDLAAAQAHGIQFAYASWGYGGYGGEAPMPGAAASPLQLKTTLCPTPPGALL